MKHHTLSWLRPLTIALAISSQAMAVDYRIDSQADFNRNRTKTFGPGDRILFKKGSVFNGMFAPKGSGSSGNPIVIDSYGSGDMPIINGLGRNEAAIFLKNVRFWEVRNMEVTNTNGSQRHQGKLKGIYVLMDRDRPQKTIQHIYIKDCFVHDVNGRTRDSDPDGAKRHGGIHVHTYGNRDTLINDLQITGNTVMKTGGVGIATDSDHNAVQSGDTDNLWTKVYIANNFIDDTDRNNMIVRDSRDPLVEYNVLANSSRANTGHSIFNFHTVGFVAQHNEAYGNTGDDGKDRGGFDADYNARNTTYQYNYSHDNMWFIGIMKRWNKGVTIRYNISQNDRDGFCFYGFNNRREVNNVVVHNNVYYLAPRFGRTHFIAEDRSPLNTDFYNNIFYFGDRGFYGGGMNRNNTNTTFSHNAYFGIPVRSGDRNAVTGNPRLVSPGSGGKNVDMTNPNRLSGYRLEANSPCIDAGRTISGVTRDFWGNPVRTGSGTDIGVHEFQPNTNATAQTFGNGGRPGSGRAWPISRTGKTRIQAQNFNQGANGVAYSDSSDRNIGGAYRTNRGVDIERTTDTGGGFNVGWTTPNEWLNYTIDVRQKLFYNVTMRSAHLPSGRSTVRFDWDNESRWFAANSTGSWQRFTNTSRQVLLEKGTQTLQLNFRDGGINVNWFEFEPIPFDTDQFFLSNTFDGESHPNDNSRVREISNGNVGALRPNTWVRYDSFNFGERSVQFLINASSGANGGNIQLRVDSPTGPILGSVAVTNTGSWENFDLFGADLNGNASGIKDLYLIFRGNGSQGLLDIRSFAVTSRDLDGFQKCCDEGSSENFSNRVDVAYGANGQYVFRRGVTGNVRFTNDFFGSDPIPGVEKIGYSRPAR